MTLPFLVSYSFLDLTSVPMDSDKMEDVTIRNFSKIGYYGRPVTELSRAELLAAVAELVDMYKECKRKNEKCKEILGKEKFESL